MPGKRAVALPKHKLVVVQWIDAVTHGGWKEPEEYAKLTSMHVASVGWVVRDTPTEITIIQTIADTMMTDSITIPKSWVQKIRRIR